MSTPQGCGPCDPPADPSTPDNRPGLPAISYRIGTRSDFLSRMIARLPSLELPSPDPGYAGGDPQTPGAANVRPLAALNTRAPDDPTIALLDAWACVADVFTFYQERIANEGFFRTATERRSMLELSRAIGYELGPGVAAGALLAFTVDSSPGSPLRVAVPVGTRVQSVPGTNQLPQTFETVEAIDGRVAWNALKPRPTQPLSLEIAGGVLQLVGLDGEPLLATRLRFTGIATNLKAGDVLVVKVGNDAAAVGVRAVTLDAANGRTTVDLDVDGAGAEVLPQLPPPIDPSSTQMAVVVPTPQTLDLATVSTLVLAQPWYEETLQAQLTVQGWSEDDLLAVVAEVLANGAESGQVFAMRQRAGFFGNNAPRYQQVKPLGATQTAIQNTLGTFKPQSFADYSSDIAQITTAILSTLIAPDPSDPNDWDQGGGRTIWTESDGKTYYWPTQGAHAFLERPAPEVVTGSLVALRGPDQSNVYAVAGTMEVTRVDYATSLRSTGLTLETLAGSLLDPNSPSSNPNSLSSDYNVRHTFAWFQSEALQLDPVPVTDVVAGNSLQLDQMVLGIQRGQWLLLSGNVADATDADTGVENNEAVQIEYVVHMGGFTTLYFVNAFAKRYVRASVTLSANVARATHGETVASEVLGSGDSTQVNQRFALKRPPLTYVSAGTATGTASTLTVRVGGVPWQEVPSLYGLPSNSPSYIVRLDDTGRAWVIFGDGRSGARLPTGTANVVAAYRTGTGVDGQVGARTLTILQSRPLGVRDVTNQLPASGAQDPQGVADARAAAPLDLLSLGRVVSLSDFESFALAFAGIGKAQAMVMWIGGRPLVSLTVASASGAPVTADSDLYQSLVTALGAVTDGAPAFRVLTYVPRLFSVSAQLRLDPTLDATGVIAAAGTALQAAFSFAERGFGQRVTEVEIVTVLQQVPGVVACRITVLQTDDAQSKVIARNGVLPALPARWSDETLDIQPAELMLLAATGVTLQQGDL